MNYRCEVRLIAARLADIHDQPAHEWLAVLLFCQHRIGRNLDFMHLAPHATLDIDNSGDSVHDSVPVERPRIFQV